MLASDLLDRSNLDCVFHPRSMAVVGLSPDPHGTWLNQVYLQAPLRAGFKGPIYPVNRRGGHIGELRVYTSLREIPGPVDYVVSCIPAEQTPDLLEECRTTGVRVVQLYTAGFSETQETSRIELQRRLLEIARKGHLRLIGPNCMGVYCPRSGMSFSLDFPKEAGNIGLMCQSGGNTIYLVRSAAARGLRFSKAISYGNACDVDECDILEYLSRDRETEVIAAYIEGVHDGRRFVDALARATAAKPVVIYKGGYTEAGVRATLTHTGSMAGNQTVWDSLVKQTGAFGVSSIEDMVDMLVALLRMKTPHGVNTCVIGVGGGASVVATDELEKAGLRLPPVPPHLQKRMQQIIPPAGGMLQNPIDAFPLVGRTLRPQHTGTGPASLSGKGNGGWGDLVELIEEWDGIDLVVFHFAFDIPPIPVDDWVTATIQPPLAAIQKCSLPLAVVFHSSVTSGAWVASQRMQDLCLREGIPFFLSLKGAAKAICNLVAMNRKKGTNLKQVSGHQCNHARL